MYLNCKTESYFTSAYLKPVFKGAAWQMIERLCRTNKPDFDILRRTLVVCSEHLEEPDIAAQVTWSCCV